MRNFLTYCKAYNPFVKKPVYLLLFVTDRCNCKCGHCFYWNNINKGKTLLSIGDYQKIAASLGGLIQLTITGGSPDLREDVPEIVNIFRRYCHPGNVTYCTNGCNTAGIIDHSERILRFNPHLNLTVDISFDGLQEELDSLRNCPGLFANVLITYKELAALRRQYKDRLRIGCGICVSGLNHKSALKTADWALNNLPLDNLTPILVRGKPRIPSAIVAEVDVFSNIANRVKNRLKTGGLKGYSFMSDLINSKDIVQKELIADIYNEKSRFFRCYASSLIAAIYPDGTIPGCELRDEILGDLTTNGMDFDEIWRGENAGNFRKSVRREKCQCYHQCYLSVNMIKSPSCMFNIFTEMVGIRKPNKEFLSSN